MRRICIMNSKGGVGKTTTAVNLAAGLSRNDKKVLLIDLDPQGNSTFSLNWNKEKDLYDFLKSANLSSCVMSLGKNLDLLGSKEELADIEKDLASYKLTMTDISKKIRAIKGYDYIIMDCSPSLVLLNKAAMLSSDEAIIPTSTDVLGLRGTSNTIKQIKEFSQSYSHDLKITKVIPTLYDQRNRICKETLNVMQNIYYDVISEPIRVNTSLKEAPQKHKSIFSYARSSRGAEDYGKLVTLIVSEEKNGVAAL